MVTTKIKKILFIIFALSILSILIVTIFSKNNNTNQIKDTSLSNPYKDPGTGEVIYDQPNKTPEGNQITYLGFSKLIDIGLTSNQLKKLKNEIEKLPISNSIFVKEISITLNTITQNIDEISGEKNISFSATINRTDVYLFTVKYNDITNIKLTIYNSSKELIYSN